MASKFTSPLLGYNNNVRHKNRVFHIQTEDSGVKHPHIITHLFMDGGRILKSVKKSYAEHIGVDGMTDIVKGMMKEQHKAMFIALRDGQFDQVVDGSAAATAAAAASVASAASAAPVPSAGTPDEVISPAVAAEPEVAAAGASGATGAVASERAIPSRPPVVLAGEPASSRQEDESIGSSPTIALAAPPVPPELLQAMEANAAPAQQAQDPAPSSRVAPSSPPNTAKSAGALSLDIDALQRASREEAGPSPLFRSASELPPPPENLFRDRPATGGYRAVPARPAEDLSRGARPVAPGASAGPAGVPPRPPPRPVAPPASAAASASSRAPRSEPPRRPAAPPPLAPSAPSASESRYAPTRPAAIFAPARPAPVAPTSIFGGDLLSDKSLDEVILSYLAEDLEPEPSTK